MLLRTAFGLTLTTALTLLAGCSSGEDLADAARGSPDAPARGTPTADDAVRPAAAGRSSDDAGRLTGVVDDAGLAAQNEVPASITFDEFCRQAELTITRWELPPALTDQIERGAIELRYRIPPGAEPLTIWMGVNIEVGDVTIGDVIRLDPAQRATFANADPSVPFPAIVMSHDFDVELDGRTRTIEVPITLASAQMFDGANGWRWSDLTETPFEVSDPRVLARFRADDVRVRLDGEFCTPVFVPLP